MLQSIIVLAIFAAACFYLGRYLYRAVTSKGCTTGCGSCKVPDFSKITAEALKKQSHI